MKHQMQTFFSNYGRFTAGKQFKKKDFYTIILNIYMNLIFLHILIIIYLTTD